MLLWQTVRISPLISVRRNSLTEKYYPQPISDLRPWREAIPGMCMYMTRISTASSVQSTRYWTTALPTRSIRVIRKYVPTVLPDTYAQGARIALKLLHGHLEGIRGNDRRCAVHSDLPEDVQGTEREHWACLCGCQRDTRYALYQIHKLGSGYKLGWSLLLLPWIWKSLQTGGGKIPIPTMFPMLFQWFFHNMYYPPVLLDAKQGVFYGLWAAETQTCVSALFICGPGCKAGSIFLFWIITIHRKEA